jgi:hypothetical protein
MRNHLDRKCVRSAAVEDPAGSGLATYILGFVLGYGMSGVFVAASSNLRSGLLRLLQCHGEER